MTDAGLAFQCNRCGGRYADLDGLLGHECPFTAFQRREAAPAGLADSETTRQIQTMPIPAPYGRMHPKLIQQAVEITPAIEVAAPASAPIPVWLEDQIKPRRKNKGYAKRRPSADVAADKAAKRAAVAERKAGRLAARIARAAAIKMRADEKRARAAEAARDDLPPDELPDSGSLPIHGPAPTENPSHPVRSSVIAPRWRRISTEPPPPIVYCKCGMALPLRPRERCENCGRPTNPMRIDKPHAAIE